MNPSCRSYESGRVAYESSLPARPMRQAEVVGTSPRKLQWFQNTGQLPTYQGNDIHIQEIRLSLLVSYLLHKVTNLNFNDEVKNY